MDNTHIRCRVVVHGRVQGVFYRDTCRREARSRGVNGWVSNRPDGTVEAAFEGPADDVESLVAWACQGPPMAHVAKVERIDETPVGETEFRVR